MPLLEAQAWRMEDGKRSWRWIKIAFAVASERV